MKSKYKLTVWDCKTDNFVSSYETSDMAQLLLYAMRYKDEIQGNRFVIMEKTENNIAKAWSSEK